MTNGRNDPPLLTEEAAPGSARLAERPLLASLALLALAQLAVPAIASPPRLLMTSLCGSGRALPLSLPVPQEEDKGGKAGHSCPMPCHGADRRRRPFAA